MTKSFSQVPTIKAPRSVFDRSSGWKGTIDSGYLIPIFCDEVLPGDNINLRATTMARLTTPIVPIMDNVFADTFFFFVPLRLLWTNFKKFMGEQRNPGDSVDFLVPQVTAPTAPGYTIGSLSDYMGLPTGIASYTHAAWWHRGYNLIWNEWFRDQNFQNSVVNNVGDGPDAASDYTLLYRGRRHDYFTSALPWPQKGTAVSLPLGTYAPVERVSNASGWSVYDHSVNTQTNYTTIGSATVGTPGYLASTSTGPNRISLDPNGGLRANLTTATAATINALRQAMQIQVLYERDARGGTRYTEINRSHFGVVSPDARLQRPEYLGGGSTQVNFHPVAQTSSTDATTPQGNLSATATFSHSGVGFNYGATEHGIILGLIQIRADQNYQQGMNKMFSRRTKLDFYWPALAMIGEQTILNKEIYCQGPAVIHGATGIPYDEEVFGYQERYAEYRYKPSIITGKFRSTAAGTLDIWHLAVKYTSLPQLGESFIRDIPPMGRVIAVPSQPQFQLDCYFKQKHARPIPVNGIPASLARF